MNTNVPRTQTPCKRHILAILNSELAYYRQEGGPSTLLDQLEARVARRMRTLPFIVRCRQPRRVGQKEVRG